MHPNILSLFPGLPRLKVKMKRFMRCAGRKRSKRLDEKAEALNQLRASSRALALEKGQAAVQQLNAELTRLLEPQHD